MTTSIEMKSTHASVDVHYRETKFTVPFAVLIKKLKAFQDICEEADVVLSISDETQEIANEKTIHYAKLSIETLESANEGTQDRYILHKKEALIQKIIAEDAKASI